MSHLMDRPNTKVKSRGTVNRKALLLCMVFLFFSQMMSSAQITASLFTPSTTDQRTTVSVDFKKVPLAEALQTLARKVNVGISYKTVAVPPKRVTYRAEETSIFKVLDEILKDTGLQSILSQDRKVIMIKKRPALKAVQQSTITGKVTDAGTGQTLPGVNIAVKGTTTGTSTDADGLYELSVESLQDTLVFSYVGYQKQTVPINGRSSIDVALRTATSSLEEMVITGVGIATEKRKLGNTIGSVKSKDLENVAISNPIDMLSGRISSLSISSSGGEGGQGSAIRLRGSSSLSLQNEPMLYVDGVRVSNRSVSGAGADSYQTSRINDINPADIDRIEVLKGASAATLYGSQANSGIIQIFTKTGHGGEQRFNFSTTQSIARTPRDFPGSYTYNPSSKKIDHINSMDENLENSYRQKYTLSAGGGNDNVTYFASTFFNHSEGVIPETKFERAGGRTNIKFFPPNDHLTARVGLAYTNTIRKSHPQYGNTDSFPANMILSSPEAVSDQHPNGTLFTPLKQILNTDVRQNVGNLFASGQLNVNWVEGVNTKVALGYNLIYNNNNSVRPVGTVSQPTGQRTILNRKYDIKTLDINTSWKIDISKNIESSFLVGAQAYFSNRTFVHNQAGDLAAPAIRILRGAATIKIFDEYEQEVKNAGFFLQEQLGFWDQLFVTGGVRFDASSAFGSELNTQTYPKIGMSYTPSTDFLNLLSSLQLRGSYGESGQQPGAFDAVRSYTPTSFLDGQNGFQPGNVGNEFLKPERSKAIEVGLDAGFINERVKLNFTYFNQHTVDALFPKQFPPSQGFLNPQLVNVGRVSSQGIEMSLATKVLKRQRKQGLVKLTLSTLDNKVEDLQGAPPLKVGGSERATNTIAEGYQPGALIGTVVDPDNPYSLSVPLDQFDDIGQVSANTFKNGNGGNSQKFLGNVLPTLTGSLFLNFNIGGFIATATISAAHGAVIWDETDLLRTSLGPLTKKAAKLQKELKSLNTTNKRKKEIAKEVAYSDIAIKGNWVDDGDYIRLKDLTFGYKIPVDQLNMGVDNFTVDLSFKNLFTITNYGGYGSPGTSSTSYSNNFNRNQDYLGIPIPRIVQMKIKVDF